MTRSSCKVWRFVGTVFGSLALVLVALVVDYNSALYVPKVSVFPSGSIMTSHEQSPVDKVVRDGQEVKITKKGPRSRRDDPQGYGDAQDRNTALTVPNGDNFTNGLVRKRDVAEVTIPHSLVVENSPSPILNADSNGHYKLEATRKEKEDTEDKWIKKESSPIGKARIKDDGKGGHEQKEENPAKREREEIIEETQQEELWLNTPAEGLESCDVGIGTWKEIRTLPIYTAENCGFIAPGRTCKHRLNNTYQQWQWMPMDCTLPWPLDGKQLLKALKDKKVLIVGDTVSTTFGEALACGLAAHSNVNARVDTSHDLKGSHVYNIRSHNITVQQLQIDWLVAWDDSEAAFRRAGIKYEPMRVLLNLDLVDPRWGDAVNESVDVLVLSSGSRWNSKVRKTFRSNKDVAYLDWSQAYRFALETVRSFIQRSSFEGLKIYRTYSPLHWPDEKQQTCAMEADVLDPELMAHAVLAREQCLEIQKEVFNSLSGWRALDITEMSSSRNDAHPGILPLPSPNLWGQRNLLSKRRRGRRHSSPNTRQPVVDCAGWCTPGVPDHWVSMFHALLAQASNSPLTLSP